MTTDVSTRRPTQLKIEATAEEIRVLLDLAGAHQGSDRAVPKGRRVGQQPRARRVPRRLLDRFEWLLEAGRTPAVVSIVRGCCSGCHLRLPTMVECQTRRSVAIHTCPHCQRMLYVPELLRESPAAEGTSPRGVAVASGVERS
jgi:hypothetical protein